MQKSQDLLPLFSQRFTCAVRIITTKGSRYIAKNEDIISHRLSDKDSYNITLKMDNHAKISPSKL